VVTAAEGSDLWRTTGYGFVHDSGHALLEPLTDGRAVEVSFVLDFEQIYDQAGVLLRVDEQTWVKSGIEVSDGVPQLGAVVTREFSDWSVAPVPSWQGGIITVRAPAAPVTPSPCAPAPSGSLGGWSGSHRSRSEPQCSLDRSAARRPGRGSRSGSPHGSRRQPTPASTKARVTDGVPGATRPRSRPSARRQEQGVVTVLAFNQGYGKRTAGRATSCRCSSALLHTSASSDRIGAGASTS